MGGSVSIRPAFIPHVRLYSVYLILNISGLLRPTAVAWSLYESKTDMPSLSQEEIAVVATRVW